MAQNSSRYGEVSESRNPATWIRKPPEIVTKTARIRRPRQTKSTARAQAGGVGIFSPFPYPNDRAKSSSMACLPFL